MPEHRLGALLTAVTVAAALAGCSGGGSDKPAGGGATGGSGGTAATGNSISIKDFMFDPTPLKAKVGQTITVTNEDTAVHTITAADKSFDSKDLKKGQTFTFKVKTAGSYDYICDIHQYMKGTLTVS